MNPRDTDPLRPEDDELLWDPVTRAFVPRPSGLIALLTGLTLGVVIGFLFAVGLVHATPRAAALPSIPVAVGPQLGAPDEAGRESPSATEAAAEVVVRNSGAPPVTEPPAIWSGTASWYAASGLIAAVPDWHFGDRPYRVRVTGNGHSVVVLVQDFCRCPGGRIIDLSDDAFRRLAPLSVGVIVVTVEDVAGPGLLTPPPTSTEP